MVRISKAPDERRAELIQAARRLFFEKGFEATSVSDIVKAVKVAQGTFYYYFNSKDEVLDAIIVELIEQQEEVLKKIAEDDSLDAREKWKRASAANNEWKSGLKDELLELARTANLQSFISQREKYRTLTRELISHQFALIIEQGIREGVFETNFPDEAADITIAIAKSIKPALMDIIINPEKYEDPVNLARRKFNATQEAMERVLHAQPGSLPSFDDIQLEHWFGAKKKEK